MFNKAWRPCTEIVNFLRRDLDPIRATFYPNALFRPIAFVKLFQYFYESNNDLQDSFEESQRTFRWFEDHVKRKKANLTAFRVHRGIDELAYRLVHDHEPLAYILGTQPFGPLEIDCRKPILIPRPETEALTEATAKMIIEGQSAFAKTRARSFPSLKILDLCCGTGCIGILLRHRLMEAGIPAVITAEDVAKGAIILTRRNVMHQNALLNHHGNAVVLSDEDTPSGPKRLQDDESWNRGSKVRFQIRQVDLLKDAQVKRLIQEDGPFDIVISNPPYIPSSEMETLDKSVRQWESRKALCGDLDGDEEGLSFYKRIARWASNEPSLLGQSRENLPSLILEVGHNQAGKVSELLKATNTFSKVDIWKDPWGVDRGLFARKSPV